MNGGYLSASNAGTWFRFCISRFVIVVVSGDRVPIRDSDKGFGIRDSRSRIRDQGSAIRDFMGPPSSHSHFVP